MYYYSIENEDAQHLGFLVVMGHDPEANAQHCESGFFALKAQADEAVQHTYQAAWRVLQQRSKQEGLCWQKQADYLLLSDAEGTVIGRLQHQYLRLDNQQYLLSDLTGTL